MFRIMAATLGLLASTGLAAAAPVAPGFCARLAPELGLSPKQDPAGDYWQTNTLNPVQRMLIGGSSMMGFAPEPLGETTPADAKRLAGMCGMVTKGLRCDVTGPVRLRVQAGGKDVKVDAKPGEHATLWTSGSRVRCRDLAAG